MFYSQNLPNNTKSLLKVKFSDFSKGINTKLSESVLPVNYAVNSYNYNFNTGSLISGLGVKELELTYSGVTKRFVTPQGVSRIIRCWPYIRYDTLLNSYVPIVMVYCDDGNFYYGRVLGIDTSLTSLNVSFSDMPNCLTLRVNNKDCFFAFGQGKIMMFDGTNVPTVYTENVPNITSLAYYAGRLFATVSGDENKLIFSDDLNPTNWNISSFEGGFIELTGERGRLKKVIEANNFLYIIREYGISRLSGFGLQSDFSIKNLYLSTGKLYYNSAILCGNVILVLCKDGIYYFNGSDMRKLDLGIDKYFDGVDNDDAVGAFLDGKYYLACRLNFNDGRTLGCEVQPYTNNALIDLDLNTFDINILRGVDISYMNPLQVAGVDKLMLCSKGDNQDLIGEICYNGYIFSDSTTKIWQSPQTDLGYTNYKKVLKGITLNTKSDIKVIFKIDDKTFNFDVKGDIKPVRVPLYLVGNKFSITFESDSNDCRISNPILEIELL